MPDSTTETPTGTKDITIQGITFTVQQPFYAGYVLDAAAAHVINQTYAENIRNNVAGLVRTAKTEAAFNAGLTRTVRDKDGNDVQVGDPEQANLDDMDLDALRAKVAQYEDDYEFTAGGTRGPRASVDPEAREALNMAKDIVRKAYKAKYADAKLPEASVIAEAAEKFLKSGSARAEGVLAEAKRRVAEAKAQALDLNEIQI